MRKKRLVKLIVACGAVWFIIVLYFYTSLDVAIESVLHSLINKALDSGKLKELMTNHVKDQKWTPKDPLEEIVLRDEEILNFYHLPMRHLGTTFTEVTTANRETSKPLAADFTFHINYSKTTVVLYEDYGPGCVYRFYFYPVMPTDSNKLYQMVAADLKKDFINLEIDGRNFWFSIQQMMEGQEWPFLFPINTQHPIPASGLGSYTPFCYQKAIKIAYQPVNPLPDDLFQAMVDCSLNELTCPVKIYSGISRHKYPYGTPVSSFSHITLGHQGLEHHTRVVQIAADILSRPEKNGPDSGHQCTLTCVELCKECKRTIFQQRYHGVISSLKFRVFETSTSKMLSDWSNILITMHWDGAAVPQVNKVPLGALFGAQGSLNDFRGAVMGRRQKLCSYSDVPLNFPRREQTGYIYFPMPFWRDAVVTLEGTAALDTSLLVCFQVTTEPNFYDEHTTAYFHAQRTYYDISVKGWRDMLSLTDFWGHIVGLMVDTDNLRPNKHGDYSKRWAALQSDVLLYTDGSQSATMLGTGVEDYFSYAHGFALAENTSYSFVGVYHVGPNKLEPLTWYCYRYHVLDPIPFNTEVHFIMEGTSQNVFEAETPIAFKDYMDKRNNGQTAFSFLVLYYAKEGAGSTVTDVLLMGDLRSEESHALKIQSEAQKAGGLSSHKNLRYVGNRLSNVSCTKAVRAFSKMDKFNFKLNILPDNKGVVLRREFHTDLKSWNQKAKIRVDGESVGIWYIPMGTLSEEYSLRHDDFLIPKFVCQGKKQLSIEIETLSYWRDISYQAIVVQ